MIGLPPTGAAIGLVEQTTFGQSTVSLERGDRLLLYTDGVVESRSVDGQLFGDERLERVVSGCRSLSANQMIDTLRTELQGFAGTKSPTDDTTMVAIRVAG
jgi:serine phosphatase RsbU (regulator of sigma subunit)